MYRRSQKTGSADKSAEPTVNPFDILLTPNKESYKHQNVVKTILLTIFEKISWLPLTLASVTGTGILYLIAVFFLPRALSVTVLYPSFRLLFGTVYPAYGSYKAIRTGNVKKYVKWMMYWIVFALFTCIETFTDIFLSWFPFYYEVKIILVIWLLSPATKGSSILYKKFVHPMLTKRETEIDEYINQAKEKGYAAVLQFGSKGINYASNVIMETALKGGGNLVSTIRKSYSLSDLSEPDLHRSQDEIDDVVRPQQRVLRPRTNSQRSSSGGRNVDMYFPEVDVDRHSKESTDYNYIRSSEDISSGYSSAEPIALSRTASLTNASKTRLRAKKAEDQQSLDSLDIESLLQSDADPVAIKTEILFIKYPFLRDLIKVKETAPPPPPPTTPSSAKPTIPSSNSAADDCKDSKNEEFKLPDKELDGKYEMFCKWLEQSEQFKPIRNDDSDFLDTISSDDDFVDTDDDVLAASDSESIQASFSFNIKENNTNVVLAEKRLSIGEEIESDSIPLVVENYPKSGLFETLLVKPPVIEPSNLLEVQRKSEISLNLSRGSSASDLTTESGLSKRPEKNMSASLHTLPRSKKTDRILKTKSKVIEK